MRRHISFCAIIAMSLLTNTVATAAAYRYELFGIDGALATVGSGIDNRGVVVGTASYDNGNQRKGFIRQGDGSVNIVQYDDHFSTELHGNNGLGQSIGSYWRDGIGDTTFVVEADGSMTEVLGVGDNDINDVGQILGGPYYEIYLWNPDKEVVWSAGADYISAGGVNNDGLVVFSRETMEDGYFRWHGYIANSATHVRQSLDFPGAHDTFLTGINNVGEVIGIWQSLSREERGAFVRHADGTFADLLPPAPGRIEPYDINDHGQIIGMFWPENEIVRYGFIATPVPEPASIALLAASTAVVTAIRRKH